MSDNMKGARMDLGPDEMNVSNNGSRKVPRPVNWVAVGIDYEVSPNDRAVGLVLCSDRAGRRPGETVYLEMTPDAARRLAYLILDNVPAAPEDPGLTAAFNDMLGAIGRATGSRPASSPSDPS